MDDRLHFTESPVRWFRAVLHSAAAARTVLGMHASRPSRSFSECLDPGSTRDRQAVFQELSEPGVHTIRVRNAPPIGWTPETVSPSWTKWTDRFDGGTIGRGIAVEIRQVTTVGSYRVAGKAKSAVTGNNLLVTYRAAG